MCHIPPAGGHWALSKVILAFSLTLSWKHGSIYDQLGLAASRWQGRGGLGSEQLQISVPLGSLTVSFLRHWHKLMDIKQRAWYQEHTNPQYMLSHFIFIPTNTAHSSSSLWVESDMFYVCLYLRVACHGPTVSGSTLGSLCPSTVTGRKGFRLLGSTVTHWASRSIGRFFWCGLARSGCYFFIHAIASNLLKGICFLSLLRNQRDF